MPARMRINCLVLLALLVSVLPLVVSCGRRDSAEAAATATSPAATQVALQPSEAVPQMGGDTVQVSIYDDDMAEDWTLANSWGVDYDTRNRDEPHSGARSIAVEPEKDYGGLFFAVSPTAENSYPRDRYLAVRFWLKSGEEPRPSVPNATATPAACIFSSGYGSCLNQSWVRGQ